MQSRVCFVFLVLFLGAYPFAMAMANDFSRATTLFQQNKYQEAYRILLDEQIKHIGEPRYDLLLARAALGAGHFHEAIFAFERVLINQPGNHIARVELAVAYYRINELESARRLLEQSLQAHPPANLKKTILAYIERINEKINDRKHKLSGLVALKQGWDSNINSATNESEIVLAIGVYRPTEGVDKETSDTFTELNTRLNYVYTVNINSEFFSSGGYTNRANNHKQFDSQSVDARMGYRYTTKLGRWSVPVSYQTVWLDEKQLREVASLSVNLHQAGDGEFIDYNLQYGQIRYPYQSALNVDLMAASFALGSAENTATVNYQFALFYGDETPTNKIYEFNARTYKGIQLRLPVRLASRHFLSPRFVYQVADYKDHHPFFAEQRTDRYASVELNWRWYFTRKWSLSSQISHTDSHSTVGLYTHQRTNVFTGINYTF